MSLLSAGLALPALVASQRVREEVARKNGMDAAKAAKYQHKQRQEDGANTRIRGRKGRRGMGAVGCGAAGAAGAAGEACEIML